MRSQGRTPMFRRLSRSLTQARLLNQRPDLKHALQELNEASLQVKTSGLSRREFIRMLAQAGLLLSVASVVPLRKARAAVRPLAACIGGAPVAVIGAGFAGLTSAYRLAKNGIPVEIFEAQNRQGGRVFSKYDFNNEGMFCELGAELVDTDHEALMHLCAELDVGTQSIIDGDKDVETALYYFGGKTYTDKDLIPAFQPLAEKLAKDQAAAFPEDADGANDHLLALDRISIAEYLHRQSDGVDNWVIRMLDVAYTNEYGLASDVQSAVNFVSYIDPDTSRGFRLFGDSDEAMRITGGNSRLTEALVKALGAQQVPLHTRYLLRRIEQPGSGEIKLTFETDNGVQTRTFGQVILALPFTLLREVEGLNELGLGGDKLRCIHELGYGTNMKVMVGFTDRHWRSSELKNVPASNANVLTDLRSQQYWETSRAQAGKAGIITNFLGGDWGAAYEREKDKSAVTLEDFDKIVPGARAKYDQNIASFAWPTFRYTKGSYSCPKVGQVTTLLQHAGTAELAARLFFAGEHTSLDYGGFMNGAIESGERVAAEIIASRSK